MLIFFLENWETSKLFSFEKPFIIQKTPAVTFGASSAVILTNQVSEGTVMVSVWLLKAAAFKLEGWGEGRFIPFHYRATVTEQGQRSA